MPAVLGALVVAAIVWAIAGGGKSDSASGGPASTKGYTSAGTFDGVSFWIRMTPHDELGFLTTGRLGNICNGAIAHMPGEAAVDVILCNDTGPTGGVESALVPITTRTATISGVPLHVLPHTAAEPADLTLAVLVVGPGAELPAGTVQTQ